jgi:hypothetical protein
MIPLTAPPQCQKHWIQMVTQDLIKTMTAENLKNNWKCLSAECEDSTGGHKVFSFGSGDSAVWV